MDGIGDTMRVSLTGDPVSEIIAARKILAAAGRRREAINIVSCPTCGRTKVDLVRIAEQVDKALIKVGDARNKEGKPPITVAVMGCAVNGPGEAKGADIGVACGDGEGLIFEHGEIIKKVSENEIIGELIALAQEIR
jgi:(E)-4-hydroxy-3-methylbut-2-enyl-diphosphate synthase